MAMLRKLKNGWHSLVLRYTDFSILEKKLKCFLPHGRFMNVSAARSRIMGTIRGKHTKSTEVALRMMLVRAGLNGWELHANHLPGKPDVLFSRERAAIFVDGCFWHGCPRCGHTPKTRAAFWRLKILSNRIRDRRNARRLKEQGFKVIRIWEHSLANPRSARQVLERIRNATSGH